MSREDLTDVSGRGRPRAVANGIPFGEIELAFIRVEDYRPPRWPHSEHPKHFHLDFEVDDIEAEQTRVVGLGATLRQDSVGPDGYGWRVYADPVGHPFCLCRNKNVTWTDGRPVWPSRDQRATSRGTNGGTWTP